MKVLMVLTSHDRLGDTGQRTGFWPEEFAAPYFVLRVRNRRQRCFQVAGQIETPRPPDPLLRRPCADREEKRETHGRGMRNKDSLPPAAPDRKGVRTGRAWLTSTSIAMRYSNGKHSPTARLQTNG